MMRGLVRTGAVLLAAALTAPFMAAVSPSAHAQGGSGALQGLTQNRNEPIRIEAVSLEVRDKEKVATFIDNVKVTQGDTTMETKRLVVFYDEDDKAGAAPKGGKKPPAASAAGGAPGQQQIRRLEARGGVVVTQKDQVATGDGAVFDTKKNTIVISGNVVLTQGQNVLRGDRLFVDLTNNVSRVESGPSGQTGRVQGLFLPGSVKDRPGSPPQAAAPAAPATTGSANQSGQPGAANDRRSPAPRPLKVN